MASPGAKRWMAVELWSRMTLRSNSTWRPGRRSPRPPVRENRFVINWEFLSPETIAPLVRNTIFSGNIHCFPKAESTNALALAAAQSARQSENSTEGAAFLADEQTAGRGRGGHSWHSEPGTGIYCSFLLRPPMSPTDALWLSLVAGIAVHDSVREATGLQADLRWPNDLLLHEKKFAGILT